MKVPEEYIHAYEPNADMQYRIYNFKTHKFLSDKDGVFLSHTGALISTNKKINIKHCILERYVGTDGVEQPLFENDIIRGATNELYGIIKRNGFDFVCVLFDASEKSCGTFIENPLKIEIQENILYAGNIHFGLDEKYLKNAETVYKRRQKVLSKTKE